MEMYCPICNQPFREDDIVKYTAYSIWHEVPSKVNYAISKPHEVDQDSFRHSMCSYDD